MTRVVIIGAGVAGLGAALLLARQGRDVVILDQDHMPTLSDGDQAFQAWARPTVPQWLLPHNFSSRSRKLLLERAPDVLDRLKADSIEEFNALHAWLDPSQHRPDDDQFTGFRCRRPAFELALRRSVEEEPLATMREGVTVAGLVTDNSSVPVVRGVRLADGSSVPGDFVFDCGGRRSAVMKWIAALGQEVPMEVQECNLTYYSRYFRKGSGGEVPARSLRGDLGYLLFWTSMGDRDTFGLVFGVPPWDAALKVLRHDWAWEALVGLVPSVREWMARGAGEPLHSVQLMAGHKNTRRHYLVDGKPLALGVLSLGDAVCTTNPAYGWGASVALTHAVAAVDALARHPGRLEDAAVDYYSSIADETDAVYRSSAAADRVRTHRWKGEAIPLGDRPAAERNDLLQRGILGPIVVGGEKDPELLRALLRYVGLLERPDEIFENEAVMRKARAFLDHHELDAEQGGPTPTRSEALHGIAAEQARMTA
ncbi:MAG: NAD(P)/FAD-dependent oxidoreductase [Acidimicrobiia bacterium]